jgi:hypothetical protein
MAALSADMSNARDRRLPDEVIETGKHHVLDTLAAVMLLDKTVSFQAAHDVVRKVRGGHLSGEADMLRHGAAAGRRLDGASSRRGGRQHGSQS